MRLLPTSRIVGDDLRTTQGKMTCSREPIACHTPLALGETNGITARRLLPVKFAVAFASVSFSWEIYRL
jgi:hypothetical protein